MENGGFVWILVIIAGIIEFGSGNVNADSGGGGGGDEKNLSGADYCGREEADPNKLCISLRLPWQPAPIYFCTEKEKVNYRRKCRSTGPLYCPVDQTVGSTLQVSTPWDCCPMFSQPDPCVNAKCPPAPFNRTCTEFYTDNYWDCCPHYHCEEGDKDACHTKKLEPGCMSHPKGKEHCLGFVDPNGCCNKYQCETDAKPGICPTLAYHRQRYITAAMTVRNNGTAPGESGESRTDAGNKSPKDNLVNASITFSNFPPTSYSILTQATIQQCVGDHTCPNSMKCCPGSIYENPSITTLVTKGSPPHVKIRSYENSPKPRVVHGYCMDPVFDKSEKQ